MSANDSITCLNENYWAHNLRNLPRATLFPRDGRSNGHSDCYSIYDPKLRGGYFHFFLWAAGATTVEKERILRDIDEGQLARPQPFLRKPASRKKKKKNKVKLVQTATEQKKHADEMFWADAMGADGRLRDSHPCVICGVTEVPFTQETAAACSLACPAASCQRMLAASNKGIKEHRDEDKENKENKRQRTEPSQSWDSLPGDFL